MGDSGTRTRQQAYEVEQRAWLSSQFGNLTTDVEVLSPSEWAEKKRYLPHSVTPFAGYYRFALSPYLREIVDCFSVDSPIREVSVMKAAQIGATVGVLENVIGYCVDHVKSSPVMMVTADADLANLRMTTNILPMLQASQLMHLVRSSDEKNTRKTGNTEKKIEWIGGGYLVPFGAQNANKLRSLSVEYLLRDEIDGWPLVVGKDGDPLKLSAARTTSYEYSRKILDLSTPTVAGISKIADRFKAGDQRYYFVCCLSCGYSQVLRWETVDKESGEVKRGMVWETQAGRLVPDSVRYLCQNCGHAHTNDDKARLLSPENGAQWRPTAEPASPDHRSYHISALYSPIGMMSWSECVKKWIEAWDTETGKPKDNAQLQVFYNNVLGETFELRGQEIRFERVSPHRRAAYRRGEIPNLFAAEFCGSPVLLLTCTVDVHKESLDVAVFGWCRDRRAVLIDYLTFDGETEQLEDAGTWGRLRTLIEKEELYVADDGKRYRIALTFIDSGYLTDQVYRFCAEYEAGVYPVKGQGLPPNSPRVPEFTQFKTPNGLAYGITVDLYKDRWSAALRNSWEGEGIQPIGHFNAPIDIDDKRLKELTAEVKRPRLEKGTGRHVGWEWHRTSGVRNELWDLLVYANAALDLMAWSICKDAGFPSTSWADFWNACERDKLFFADAQR